MHFSGLSLPKYIGAKRDCHRALAKQSGKVRNNELNYILISKELSAHIKNIIMRSSETSKLVILRSKTADHFLCLLSQLCGSQTLHC